MMDSKHTTADVTNHPPRAFELLPRTEGRHGERASVLRPLADHRIPVLHQVFRRTRGQGVDRKGRVDPTRSGKESGAPDKASGQAEGLGRAGGG